MGLGVTDGDPVPTDARGAFGSHHRGRRLRRDVLPSMVVVPPMVATNRGFKAQLISNCLREGSVGPDFHLRKPDY